MLSSRIDQMTYRMDFDPVLRRGTVVINIALVPPAQLRKFAGLVQKVFERGYAMGRLVSLLAPGEMCGDVTVPANLCGFCTVCSVTLNGVLLKNGIPVQSRFGGLMELVGGKATRFVEMIMYDGTSMDPLEVFIRSGMTDYLGAIRTGHGRIGAGFREIPAEARERVEHLAGRLEAVGLGGFLEIGRNGQTLLGIPVRDGRAGVVVIGGLNPVAVFEESGVRLFARALSGQIDYDRLFDYTELGERCQGL